MRARSCCCFEVGQHLDAGLRHCLESVTKNFDEYTR